MITENIPPELQGHDEILGEAGLSGQIGGGTEEQATTGSSVYVPADKAEDTQLQYAIRLILGEETQPGLPAQGGRLSRRAGPEQSDGRRSRRTFGP